ncbi:pyridoxal phosphate-dependent aminotransferase [Tissierella carlieri]|uniref:MalY/PatB family protein n=1 Tax=Tissierella carlieri TaxID=689904 RepID=UPI001C0F778F|nr:MalY/PatB family protein [Tissierella carlieri]MBU5310985.1 pyridoxal phosphate-dependent aminotransferase [Tissierella carlieri]
MGKLNLDKLYDRRGTDCVKWDHKDFVDRRVSDTALPLWLSDMEFKVADEITEALTKRVEHGFLGHSMPGDSYFESVQGWYKRRFNWTISKDSIFYSPGVLPALGFALRGFTKEGEGIIIQEPVFYPFAELIEGTDRKVVNNQLINNDENYSIDFVDLENKLKNPNNTMLILCSPHNPVGRVWTKDELKKVVDLCQENDVLIFSDELHCDLTRANVMHYPIKTITDYSKIITAVALGKTFNVGGVPISQIIIDDEELKQIWHKETRRKHYISFAPPLDMVLTETAYNKCEYWVDEVMEYVEGNFDFLVNYLNKHLPKVKYKKPEGTFLAWINFGAYVDYEELFELLITKYDLLIENGHVFGESGAGYFRMTVACPQSMLEEGLDRIVKAIKELTDN